MEGVLFIALALDIMQILQPTYVFKTVLMDILGRMSQNPASRHAPLDISQIQYQSSAPYIVLPALSETA